MLCYAHYSLACYMPLMLSQMFSIASSISSIRDLISIHERVLAGAVSQYSGNEWTEIKKYVSAIMMSSGANDKNIGTSGTSIGEDEGVGSIY